MSHFRKPLRYNVTVQWSDSHDGYICFVGALIKSAKMFAPDLDMVGCGTSPEAALTAGLNAAYAFLDMLTEMAILPPSEEITPVSDPVERELTADVKPKNPAYDGFMRALNIR